MGLAERLYDDALGLLPPRLRRPGIAFVTALLVVGGLWYIHHLRNDVGECRRDLVPFQAAALRAFPGDAEAVQKLGEKLDTVLGLGERAFDAQLQNCYADLAVNEMNLGALTQLTSSKRPMVAAPRTKACSDLRDNPGLDAALRGGIFRYINEMDQAGRVIEALNETCRVRQISQEQLDATKLSVADWLDTSTAVKDGLRSALASRRVEVPVVERRDEQGNPEVCLSH